MAFRRRSRRSKKVNSHKVLTHIFPLQLSPFSVGSASRLLISISISYLPPSSPSPALLPLPADPSADIIISNVRLTADVINLPDFRIFPDQLGTIAQTPRLSTINRSITHQLGIRPDPPTKL